MLAIIRCKIFSLPVYYPQISRFKIYRTIISPVFRMGMKHDRSHWGRKITWRCLRVGCWGEYLDLRGLRQERSAETYIKRSLIIWTPQQILFGWSNREEWCERVMYRVWVRREKRCVQGYCGKPEGKKPIGRPKRRWRIMIRWISRKWDGKRGMHRIDLAHVNAVMKLRIP